MLIRPLLRIALAALLVLIVAVGWFALQVDPLFSSAGKDVIITVTSGESFSSIASDLHAKGVIASPLAFRAENFILGTPIILAGSYELHQRSSFATVRSILGSVPNVEALTVSPGLTLKEVVADVAKEKSNAYATQFMNAMTNEKTPSTYSDGSSLEGLIGSGTYIIKPSTPAATLAHDMVARFEQQAASVGLKPTTTIAGLSSYQLITAASIVEKEGYYPRNMPKVARVILNRLARGGPLQMDATVLYYFHQDGGTVTHAMLETATPYNTYLNAGLTPTPICAVSTIALKAVLHAPAGPWLYFTVINQSGDEAFSTTFAEQLKNEQLAASRGIG